jgi:TRAP-type C4-dicarboxylate transport system permease small subunit
LRRRALRAGLVLRGAADALAAALLLALFATFVLQIAFRYLLNWPVGWTVEVCLTLWLWLVLLGAALCVPDREHVRFDLLEQRLSPRGRRLAGLLVALALLAGFAAVLEPSYDYVSFYKIKRSATLRIPLSWVFSVFLLFAGALVLRQAWAMVRLLREPSEPVAGAAETTDPAPPRR